ncbi:MAG: flavin reductase family protein [Burkholderiales bacterium]|jgi:flavin reductase (DIM6/NTAB) family NADH-FMN oxidoreductase RutF|nr:flavin reductase family protein [Burkholderiales bacterium]
MIKKDFPVFDVRRFLEPGAIVLVSSHHGKHTNIMTMGWHTVMEFTPSLVGCVISSANWSYSLIAESKECVINVPTTALLDTVVQIGNTTGAEIDKFKTFGLTPKKAARVKAPLIQECFANLECRLYDDTLLNRYNFFIFEVVKAHALPGVPETLHYQGGGKFRCLNKTVVDKSELFREGMM